MTIRCTSSHLHSDTRLTHKKVLRIKFRRELPMRLKKKKTLFIDFDPAADFSQADKQRCLLLELLLLLWQHNRI